MTEFDRERTVYDFCCHPTRRHDRPSTVGVSEEKSTTLSCRTEVGRRSPVPVEIRRTNLRFWDSRATPVLVRCLVRTVTLRYRWFRLRDDYGRLDFLPSLPVRRTKGEPGTPVAGSEGSDGRGTRNRSRRTDQTETRSVRVG